MIYCLRQKKYTETKNEETIQTKNGRLIMKGICVECGAKKSKFVKSNIGGSFDIHSAIGKLPRPKNGFTPGKYKFMGPYNPLDKQLEYDREGNITKYHVKPYNEIDAINAQHDVDYTICGNDTSCKNTADRKMVQSIDNLPYSKVPKWGMFARTAINAKQKLGMGSQSKVVGSKNNRSRRMKF